MAGKLLLAPQRATGGDNVLSAFNDECSPAAVARRATRAKLFVQPMKQHLHGPSLQADVAFAVVVAAAGFGEFARA
jgi:hypothetical protein